MFSVHSRNLAQREEIQKKMGCEMVNGLGRGWRMPSKPCDSCRTGVAALYCRADSAFICLICDDRIHGANKLASRHARVWLCEVCEHAPAAVTCKADAAVLCISCDADIHSANPLARRHERVPVVPFLDSAAAALKPTTCELDVFLSEADRGPRAEDDCVPPWLLPTPCMEMEVPKIIVSEADDNNIDLLNVMDPYVDFDFGFPVHGSDSVVPVQVKTEEPLFQVKPLVPAPEKCFDIEFCRSKLTSFCFPDQSISKNLQTSSSSHDFGVVPDGSTTTTNNISDRSQSFVGSINSYVTAAGSINSCIADPPSTEAPPAAPVPATPLFGVDREARVLRYREKRKNRKFEKTIRYASRKAYAETRPRIKGRFAKRTDSHDHEPQLIDNIIFGRSATALFFVDSDFGLVPTF